MTGALKRLHQSGFTLVETMIAIGLGSILALGVSTLLSWTVQIQTAAMTQAVLEAFQQNMIKNLASEAAWRNTLSAGAATGMGCLTNLNPCTTDDTPGGPPIQDRPFVLYSVGGVNPGSVIFDSTNPSNGLTSKGIPCNTFSAAGNDACPFRYDLKWSAVCTPGNCVSPQVVVNAILMYRPLTPTKLVLNVDRYSINSFYPGSSSSSCLASSQVFAVPGTYTFTVPSGYQYMMVEEWGAGGGGAGVFNTWGGCFPFVPGTAGGPTSFGGLVANGGPPGNAMVAGGSHQWNWCVWAGYGPVCGSISFADCNGSAASNQGGDGYPTTPFPGPTIPPNMQLCSTGLSVSAGLGGRPAAAIGSRGAAGSAGGGGGAGSPPKFDSATFIGVNWSVVTFAFTRGGMGAYDVTSLPGLLDGHYNKAIYTPATLAPGSNVTVIVGAGGNGGNSNGWVGGKGANGIVRIVYW